MLMSLFLKLNMFLFFVIYMVWNQRIDGWNARDRVFFFLIFYPKTLELYSINITSALIKSIRNKS
jgi:hypothetical protein